MISKIKDIALMGRRLEALDKKVGSYEIGINELSTSIKSLGGDISTVKKELQDLGSMQHEFLKTFREEMGEISRTREQFSKSVYDFNILKKEMQKEILNKFDSKLKEELIKKSKELEISMENYEELKNKVDSNRKLFEDVSVQMKRLTDIAQGVKKADLEFSSFAQQLKKSQDEKLELQRKIDSLERLVSRIRRK